ncbi:MAG: diguanylate cyclase [Planctomycetes bacterium]|nr:diguanylate cyclase [Planctomycetota bacterium]
MNVLVVDDEIVSRQMLEKVVANLGYEVVSAGDGLGAWNVLRQRDVQFVIADWEMPGMNGLSLCKRARSGVLGRYVYFILLTSRTKRDDIIKGLEAGADDYITKPFDAAELRVRLRAGQRVIDLEKELSDKNKTLEDLTVRLERAAVTDPLLEIGNRRALYEFLDRVEQSCQRSGEPYTLVMCDVDNFKAYNDIYGHLAGDDVLKDAAGALSGALRFSDRVFRFGGEEFVAVLPGTDCEAGRKVAGRMLRAIEDLQVEHSGSAAAVVTISCGIACSHASDSDEARPWAELLKSADVALYQAKEQGKNRSVVAAGSAGEISSATPAGAEDRRES